MALLIPDYGPGYCSICGAGPFKSRKPHFNACWVKYTQQKQKEIMVKIEPGTEEKKPEKIVAFDSSMDTDACYGVLTIAQLCNNVDVSTQYIVQQMKRQATSDEVPGLLRMILIQAMCGDADYKQIIRDVDRPIKGTPTEIDISMALFRHILMELTIRTFHLAEREANKLRKIPLISFFKAGEL